MVAVRSTAALYLSASAMGVDQSRHRPPGDVGGVLSPTRAFYSLSGGSVAGWLFRPPPAPQRGPERGARERRGCADREEA
ncbi:MAG TPA: hypothetical protein VMW15_11005 [Terracidiphilus sp.]|nr:hypothetical protein [Terracidiphilus sp.]